MSISRLALLALTLIVSSFLVLAFMLPSTTANAQQQGYKFAETPFKFVKIFDGPGATLEADPSTYTSMLDEDDDLIVAGVFRLTRKNALPGEKAVFVTVTLAICGHAGVVVVHSKDFTADGKPAGETTNPQPILARPDTAAGATYISLCGSNTKPTPVDPGYKAPDRYTKFWV